MRISTEEEVEITMKLSREADTLTEEEREQLIKRLCEIDDEQTNGFTWTT